MTGNPAYTKLGLHFEDMELVARRDAGHVSETGLIKTGPSLAQGTGLRTLEWGIFASRRMIGRKTETKRGIRAFCRPRNPLGKRRLGPGRISD